MNSERGQRSTSIHLSAHLLLLLLLGHLQSWWVGEGGGLTVGSILHLGHLNKKMKKEMLITMKQIKHFKAKDQINI